jgi:hypothetical protein
MLKGSKEYSLAELIEHPILSVQITSDGIEHRCLELMLDTTSDHYRCSEAVHEAPLPD